MKIRAWIFRRAHNRNAVCTRAIVAIAYASSKLSQLCSCGDFGDGEFARLDDDVIVSEAVKLDELWRHLCKFWKRKRPVCERPQRSNRYSISSNLWPPHKS